MYRNYFQGVFSSTPTEIKRGSERGDWACPVCKADPFTAMFDLVKHMNKQHGIDRNRIMCDIKCSICSRTFPSEIACRRHLESVHEGNSRYKCDICGQGFHSTERYVTHLTRHEGAHQCDQCDKSFAHKDILHLHIKKYHVDE